jgi:hypothetical protein
MKVPSYYLSSLDSYALEAVRACSFTAFKHFDTGKLCVLAELDPPIVGQQFGLRNDVRQVILASRHEGGDLSNIQEFPCFVHVAALVADNVADQEIISTADLQNLAWGELYRTRSDAEHHRFDQSK